MTPTEELESDIRNHLDTVRGYAGDAVNKAQTLTDALKAAFSDIDTSYRLGWAQVNIPEISTDLDVEKPGTLDVSKATSLLSNVQRPSPYLPGTLPSITPLPYNAFTAELPALSLPKRPSRTQETKPQAEQITLPDMPAAPDAVLPAVPSFSALTIEEGPALVAIEPFTDALPEFSAGAPAGSLTFEDLGFHQWKLDRRAESDKAETSDLLMDVRKYVQNTLYASDTNLFKQFDKSDPLKNDEMIALLVQTGAAGLPKSIEQSVYDRAMERYVLEARRNLEASEDEYAAAGYPLPPGALRATRRMIRRELTDRSEALCRDIISKQIELIQEAHRYYLEMSKKIEETDWEMYHKTTERSFAFARATKEVAISIFNAQIAEHNARLEGYKTRAQVHEINVRAALQELENRRVYLEGKRLEGSLRQQELDLYRAQVQGVESLFSLYRSQLEGVRVEGDIERLKLEKFRGEMEGFIAGIRADEAEFSAYQAELAGERSKIDAFVAQAQAYRAETEAKKTYTDAQAANLTAQVERERARIDQYRAEQETYRSDLDRNRTAIEAVISEYRANNETYRAAIAKAESEGRLKVADVQAQIQASVADREMMNAHFRKEADVFLALQNLGLSGVQTAAGVQGQLASAALSSITNISQLSAGFTTVEE